MDYNREGGNTVQILTGSQNWGSDSIDSAVWATEDEYGAWNREASVEASSNPNYDTRTRSPPNKRRNSQPGGDNRSKAIGKMFFKTKLCCKFRAGTCPYITNCNFAHSVEELRRPPPSWQEIVAAHEEEKAASSGEPREEFQIPIVGSSLSVESHRSHKGRHCKKFYTEDGCPYGDSCTFLHDEQSRARESVAISLGPGSGGTGGGGGGGGSGGGGGGYVVGGAAGSNIKPTNWKTRICNKWEMTGYCPFGNKCHFAHGSQELHQYAGGPMEPEGAAVTPSDMKRGTTTLTDNVIVGSASSVSQTDGYHIGVPPQRLSISIGRTTPKPHQKWKGPDKISRIYGDWIEDIE
ncbi:zinc finger CCCH domain-containing protein 12-like [Impatiens glandulifera]|uniref:zinc finger CCCH domain-containing protein 12-like n=1 Tax=Impatiens glandulifera TaxID=253017 RepID=UPI001FB068F8|nr:zinc finger CCCH domain-containing protein 12-like [Impatiens glandulifera]